jgi:hypothetical protein
VQPALPRTFAAIVAAFFCLGTSFAQTSLAPRITQQVDDTKLVTLQHNVHPLARAQYDRGAAPLGQATGRLQLVLQRSPGQQAALTSLLSSLQTPGSPNYRHWLTPTAYGKQFGIGDQDLQTVQNWLSSQGFTGVQVSPARNLITFSGNVGRVNQAFHTSIHQYVVNGEVHYANATDPQIPEALSGVVNGVAHLNDFRPKAHSVAGPRAAYDTQKARFQPQFTQTSTTGTQYFTPVPADAAIIYDTPNANMNPSYHGTTYDGSGVTIGIVGDSNLSAQAIQDIANFRALFLNDPNGLHAPNIIVDGNDPGENGDETEALTDIELAEGIAPGANVNFYTAANTDLSQGLMLAIQRALNDNAVNILNVSFGSCEYYEGASGNAAIAEMWQQAASQGITVTVSSGDSGSANCDADSETEAQMGLAVNGLASTPYNVAVGGTDFTALFNSINFATYVNPGTACTTENTASTTPNPVCMAGAPPYRATALGYIPEQPWNDSTDVFTTYNSNTPYFSGNGATTDILGTGGGMSSLGYCAGGLFDGFCIGNQAGYPKPPFQSSQTPADGVRDLPDISLFAGALFNNGGSNNDFTASWTICSDSGVSGASNSYVDCQLTNGQPTISTTTSTVGGTSTAAPTFAGMLALVSQSLNGVRLGQANNVLYNLAATQPSIYHDVTEGNNSVYCETDYTNCASNNYLPGYNAGPGYDYASGLGSLDVAKLVTAWPTVTFTPTTTTFQAGTNINLPLGTTPITAQHGFPIWVSVGVNPSTTTGSIAFVTSSAGAIAESIPFANGTSTPGYYLNPPGGQYTLYADYSGDATNAASQSNGISVNITPENSTLGFQPNIYSAATGASLGTGSVPYGQYVFLQASPYGVNEGQVSSASPATGTVTITQNGAALTQTQVNSTGIASYQVNPATLTPGTYTWSAAYSGDSSYNPSTSSPTTLTVTKGAPLLTLSPTGTDSITSIDGSVKITVTMATASLGLAPTGTLTLYMNGTAFGTTTLQNGGSSTAGITQTASFTVTPAQIGAGKSATFYATYAGDTNYQAETSPTTTITYSNTPPTMTLTPSGTTSLPVTQGTQYFALDVYSSSTGPLPTGTATFYVNGTAVGTAALANGGNSGSGTVALASLPVSLSQIGAGNTASIYAAYSGDSYYAGGNSPTTTLTVTGTPSKLTPVLNLTPSESQTISPTGPNLNLTLSVSPSTSGAAMPTGTATFYMDGNSIGTATLQGGSSSATASFTVAPSQIGVANTVSFYAAYSGDANYVGGNSATISVTVSAATTPTISSQAPSAPVTIGTPGQSGTTQISYTPLNGFRGTVSFTCSVTGPAGATNLPTCTVPGSTTITGTAAVPVTVTIATTGSSTTTAAVLTRIGGAALASLLFIGMQGRRRRYLAPFVMVLLLSISLSGCGSKGSSTSASTTGTGTGTSGTGTTSTPTTTAGTYTVTVIATPTGAAAVTTQFSLIVE